MSRDSRKSVTGVVDPRRVEAIRDGAPPDGPVVYWMSRDQRAQDNWALLYAREMAAQLGRPLVVLFALAPGFLGATLRQYDFMLRGLEEVERNLRKLRIPFVLLTEAADRAIPRFARMHGIGLLVADFSPLRIHREWLAAVVEQTAMPVYQVDAHNIVPCRFVSDKQEYGARTIRRKINDRLPEFLTEFPPLRPPTVPWEHELPQIEWAAARKTLQVDITVGPVDRLKPGSAAGRDRLALFLEERLPCYDDRRNDPNEAAQSDLSLYLHFGQISAQRVALETQRYDRDIKSQEAFLEQVIVRRELSDNFCHYNRHYDSFDGFPDWAKRTLDEHRSDPREYLYTREQFERAETHDDLWNAAQLEMIVTGKMHGYMRMYWAKKILEWSASPEEAMHTAVALNDRYELDGRDPNGYVGIAWSIGGVHDRPWFERDIFGKIRYMSASGCARKFDVNAYIKRIDNLAREAIG